MQLILVLTFLILAGAQAAPMPEPINAKEFLQQMSSKLYKVLNICQALEEVEKILSAEEMMDHVGQLKLELSGMKSLYAKVKQFDSEIANDDDLKHAFGKLKHAIGIFTLEFEEVVSLGSNLKALANITLEPNVPDYYDADELKAYWPTILNFLYDSDASEEEIKFYWIEWRAANEKAAIKALIATVETLQKAAKDLELSVTKLWSDSYNNGLVEQMDTVMKDLEPLYKHLHAYMRHKLFQKYGAGIIKPTGQIPDHLYEYSMMQIWESNTFFDDDFPYDNVSSYFEAWLNSDVEKEKHFFEIAEDYFVSLGFEPLTEEFQKTKLVLDEDDEGDDDSNCQPKINDLTPDAALRYCKSMSLTDITEYFGRLHYAQARKGLPAYYFEGYNLKYAVNDVLVWATATPKYLTKIEVLKDFEYDEKAKLNRNFQTALYTIFNMPQYYAYIKVMVGLLEGTLQKKDANKYYWTLMEQYGGIEPSVDRFDTSFDLPYDFYRDISLEVDFTGNQFIANVLGMQFYKALCEKTGHKNELSECDLYGQKEAGKLIIEMLSVGSSKPWQEVIGIILGKDAKLDAAAMLEYFAPIRDWLEKYVKAEKLELDWEPTTKKLSESDYRTEAEAKIFVKESSEKIYKLYNQILSDLFGQKHLLKENEETFWLLSKSALAARELTDISLETKKFNVPQFEDADTARAIKKLARIADIFVLGKDLEDLLYSKKNLKEMATDKDITRYKADEDSKDVSLYPYILNIFLNSSDPEELKYYWNAWRERNSYYAKSNIFDVIEYFEKAAAILGFTPGQFWRKQFTLEQTKIDLNTLVKHIPQELEPLYIQLHAFIRAELLKKYGAEVLAADEPIPDHLFEQVLLQVWTNRSIIEEYFPFEKLAPGDQFIAQQKYDALKMLHVADEFYQSLGFEPIEQAFWQRRVASQPSDNDTSDCHATIYDATPTVYMQYCEQLGFKKFLQAHGYMGRVHYAHEKHNLPAYFFDSYLLEYPVGEAVILSASSPKHLQTTGLAGDFVYSEDVMMNRLLRMGIHTLLKIHLHYVHIRVINDYLEKKVSKKNFPKYYWKQMLSIGVEPPMNRTSDDFDFPYEFYTDLEQNHQLKKFVSEVLGYQFYEAFCHQAESEGQLSNCDFFGNKKVGTSLQKMMQLGSSKSLRQVLQTVLPDSKTSVMNAKAIMKYYEPMLQWLKEINEKHKNHIGFGKTKKKFLSGTELSDIKTF